MEPVQAHRVRQAWRDVVRRLWTLRGEAARLPPEQARIVRVLEQHPEFRRFFEDPALDDDAGDDGVNPFLHVQIHVLVESQLASGDPGDAGRALERLVAAGVSRHDAIHRIGEALVREMASASRDGEAFDAGRYALRLRGLDA